MSLIAQLQLLNGYLLVYSKKTVKWKLSKLNLTQTAKLKRYGKQIMFEIACLKKYIFEKTRYKKYFVWKNNIFFEKKCDFENRKMYP